MLAALFWRRGAIACTGAAAAAFWSFGVPARVTETVTIRGQAQELRICGLPGGDPIVVSSGDGGWTRLSPHIAEVLAARALRFRPGREGLSVRLYVRDGTLRGQTSRGLPELLAESRRKAHEEAHPVCGRRQAVRARRDYPLTKAAISGVVAL